MRKIKLLFTTLIMCLVYMTSYSQENPLHTNPHEQNISNIKNMIDVDSTYVQESSILIKQDAQNMSDIDLRLNESSTYLIKANNQAIGAVVVSVATGLLSGLLIANHKPAGFANKTIGTGLTIAAGAAAISLSISSIVNKRKGYNALRKM